MPDYSLSEAARRLGTTTEALRARLKRKSLEGFRDNKGRWRVRLDADQTGDGAVSGQASGRLSEHVGEPSEHDRTLVQMREHVARLEGKLEGIELRLADRDRELTEVKAERDRLLTMLSEAQQALVLRSQGVLAQLWDKLFGPRL